MNASVLMGRLGPFQNRQEILTDDQSTKDIIDAILKAHERHAQDYSKISSFFNTGSRKETARKIYNFLKGNVKYVIEPGSKQTVKSPSAILAQGYGDCKHYSLFAGGILQNLGIPFSYRFASYRVFNKEPQHVFVVVNPGTKNEIWIDPVLNKFDYKKAYTYATDRKPMALYSISGIGATAKQKADLKSAKAAKKAASTKAMKKAAVTEVKAARKAAGRITGQVLKKGAKAVLKVAASPVRNAFLALVALNFAGLGNKLAAAWQKAPSKITNFWEGVGGKLQALKTAWEKGSKKKRIFGDDTIGAAPAAAATAAAPLLVKVANVLRDIGIDPAELVQLGKDALNAKAQELAKKALEPKAATEAKYINVADQVFDEESAPSMEITQTPAFTEKVATSKPNFLPWVIGGAAVYYLIIRK
jgi:hypothetical protein